MSRESTLVLFGILTVLSPFAGLPTEWLEILLPAFGLVIAITAYTLRRQKKSKTESLDATSVAA